MKKLIALSLAAGMAASAASAKVSFSLAIDALSNSGSQLYNSGLVVLVVDTGSDGFQLPSDGNLVSGNDEVVAYWDLADYDFEATKAVTLTTDGGVAWGSNWSANDRLALFWFPTLTGSNMTPGADTAYGVFADAIELASGDAWKMPVDGTLLHSLKLFTAAATTLVSLGDYPSGAGITAFAVNNPPSTGTPNAPSVGVTASGSKNMLSWTSAGDPGIGFIVQRKRPGGAWETIGFASGSDTGFSDMNVKPGLQYQYQLVSVDTFAFAASDTLAIVSERSVFRNLSTKAYIFSSSGEATWSTLVAGIRVTGADPSKRFLIQGFGPRGGSSYIEDPVLALEWHNPSDFQDFRYDGQSDNWMEDFDDPSSPNPDAVEIDETADIIGAQQFELNSADSAIIANLDINTSYIAALTTVEETDDGQTRIGITNAEYDPATANDNRIVNLSTKGYLSDASGTEFNGGVVIQGSVPKEVLVVASGPELSGTNKASALLPDPTLELRAVVGGEGIKLATNDNWDEAAVVEANATSNGLVALEMDIERVKDALRSKNFRIDDTFEDGSPRFSLDSAMLVTLNPGLYLFEVKPKSGTRAFGTVKIGINEVEME